MLLTIHSATRQTRGTVGRAVQSAVSFPRRAAADDQ